MTITPATETAALQQRRPPTYFPGNDEDPRDAPPAPSADFSFSDFLDVINPLQHIPVVSSIYRAITGDTISPTANVMGSALFGGPVGALAAAATEMFSEMTGGSPEEHLVAMLDGESAGDPGAAPQPAQAAPPALVAADAALPARDMAMVAAANTPAAPALPQTVAQTTAEAAPPAPLAPPLPSPLFQALQSPAGTASSGAPQVASGRNGRDIRSYFAESAHVPRVPVPAAVATKPPAHTATAEGATPTAETRERDEMRAAVAAAHARGIEMLRQQGQAQSASPPQDVPDWFADRMMQGLSRYREGSQLGTVPSPGLAAAG